MSYIYFKCLKCLKLESDLPARQYSLMISEFRIWSHNASVQNLTLQFTNHVTLDKVRKQVIPQSPNCKMRIAMKFNLQVLIRLRELQYGKLLEMACYTASPQLIVYLIISEHFLNYYF